MLALATVSTAVSAQTEPYNIYGGNIETETKNAAVEACEYQELVEAQRCNRRANKTTCIKEVHRDCREKHADAASKDRKPDGK